MTMHLASVSDGAMVLVRDHMHLAAPIVLLLGFAESIVFLSLLVPSTILFLGIGAIHHAAGGSFVSLWLAGAAGALAGDIVSYAVGRYLKADIAQVVPFRHRPEWYVLARVFVRRWGMAGIVASKFAGGLRPFVPVVAGAMGMSWIRFLPASAASCLAWAGIFLAPGYGIGMIWF